MKQKNGIQARLAQLPQIDRLLQLPVLKTLLEKYPRALVLELIRDDLERVREKILAEPGFEFQLENFVMQLTTEISAKLQPGLRRTINGAGIILHTNMGRAPLSPAAQQALAEMAENYCNLELDLVSGKRSQRHLAVEALLCRLTGAEAGLVVNNNAAATLLVLNTLASNRSCVISRGELITIGGSFRLPEVMRHGGAKMVEVGTTNQTLLADYEEALDETTALLMKVHTSNYKVIGFTAAASLTELVALGRRRGIPVYHDVGSGALTDLSRYGLPKEPVIRESLEIGADVVSFSGDKLIGGPQSGIIVGKKIYLDQMKKNHLTRALRSGKLTYAALEATLRLFLDEANLGQTHAVMQLLTKSIPEIEAQIQRVMRALPDFPGQLELIDGVSEAGGGSLATETLPTKLLTITLAPQSPDEVAQQLRENSPPIISRIQNNRVCLDFRTIREDEEPFILVALRQIASKFAT